MQTGFLLCFQGLVINMIFLQVDTHIQHLDQYLKRFGEEIRRGTAIPTIFCNS